ncbi:MAG: apolipoprotein N-acyltransferase [Hyphomicrobiales bacterium]
MHEFALKFIVLWGWRRLLVAVLAGIVCAVAAPPLYILPAQIISLCVLVWLLDGISAQTPARVRAFWPALATGWSFGFGYFLVSLFWVSEAFQVEAELFAWMIPLVLVIFPLMLGIFYGVATGLAMLFWGDGFARIFAIASAFAAAEWMRGILFTGFPWNALGYSAGLLDGWLQLAAFGGLYSLTFFMVFICAAPAVLADKAEEESGRNLVPYMGLGIVAAIAVLAWGIGTYRLTSLSPSYVENVKLRIVQPNIAQKEKWKPANREAIFKLYLELSDAATSPERSGVHDITHLIWPESAVPFLLEENPKALSAIGNLLPENVTLITGGLRLPEGSSVKSPPESIFNSVLVVDADGKVTARSDKFHLVPFGEYLPLGAVLEPLGFRKLVTLPGGFIAGQGPRTLPVPNAPAASPLICYEAIFSGNVIDDSERPGWLLNVTNDAWFGDTFGPRQHFAQARMRAIEEGLPMVRAANTGISAVIGPYGRVLQSLPLGTQGVLDAKLPDAASPTLFFGIRNLFFAMLIFLGFLCAIFIGKVLRKGHN